MAKLKKLVSLLVVSLMLCSCASSGMLKNIENRVYDGEKGAQLIVMKENFKSPPAPRLWPGGPGTRRGWALCPQSGEWRPPTRPPALARKGRG